METFKNELKEIIDSYIIAKQLTSDDRDYKIFVLEDYVFGMKCYMNIHKSSNRFGELLDICFKVSYAQEVDFFVIALGFGTSCRFVRGGVDHIKLVRDYALNDAAIYNNQQCFIFKDLEEFNKFLIDIDERQMY